MSATEQEVDRGQVKAEALVKECLAVGLAATLFWDRGPHCAQVFLTSEYDEFAPSLLVHVEDDEAYWLVNPDGKQFGWDWYVSISGYEEDPRFSMLSDSVSLRVLERNHVGDTELDVAMRMRELVTLLRAGTVMNTAKAGV